MAGRMFDRYIGIDYSGAFTPTKRFPGLAVCCAVGDADPVALPTYAKVGKNWTRTEIAHWLVKRLQEPVRTLVGIDHGFGFPIAYFNHYSDIALGNWDYFLDDFQKAWQTDELGVTVRSKYYEQIERMMRGEPDDCRFGRGDWFRLTDPVEHQAKSVFDFITKKGDVAFSTHAGLPWLRYIRQKLTKAQVRVHFWPFDKWEVPEGQSVVVEVYSALWNKCYKKVYQDPGGHKHDAYSVARWMSETDQNGLLRPHFNPGLSEEQKHQARTEGWIFGWPFPN